MTSRTIPPACTLAVVLLMTAVLAGCMGDAQGSEESAAPPDSAALAAPLHGWVFDAAFRPMAAVTLEVLETGHNATTDRDGYYAFKGLPTDQAIILVATHEGYRTSSKQVTLPPDREVRLNFTMEPVPVKQPRMEGLKFNGVVACAVGARASNEDYGFDCSFGAPQNNVWEFAVGADLAGAVIEIAWEPGHPYADSFFARLETLGLGDLNTVLAEHRGESVLRLQVPESVAQKYYLEGGHMRLTVQPGPDTGGQETDIGAVVLVQQEFEAFASLFYVAPPDPDFTIQGV